MVPPRPHARAGSSRSAPATVAALVPRRTAIPARGPGPGPAHWAAGEHAHSCSSGRRACAGSLLQAEAHSRAAAGGRLRRAAASARRSRAAALPRPEAQAGAHSSFSQPSWRHIDIMSHLGGHRQVAAGQGQGQGRARAHVSASSQWPPHPHHVPPASGRCRGGRRRRGVCTARHLRRWPLRPCPRRGPSGRHPAHAAIPSRPRPSLSGAAAPRSLTRCRCRSSCPRHQTGRAGCQGTPCGARWGGCLRPEHGSAAA